MSMLIVAVLMLPISQILTASIHPNSFHLGRPQKRSTFLHYC